MSGLKESYKLKGLRQKLIDLLRTKGIQDEAILSAMNLVPRHFFVDHILAEHCYEDKALSIDMGQTISQPYTVAYQTSLLNIDKKGLSILEIGTGSGYQAAILSVLGAQVFSIERHKELSHKAHTLFEQLGLPEKIRLFVGDGSLGLPDYAPFDRIIVTCAAPSIGESLVSQLKSGGIMVVPVGNVTQTMYKIHKQLNGELVYEKYDEFKFVPLIGKEGF